MYRDDLEAALARNAALEHELALLRETTVAVDKPAPAPPGPSRDRWYDSGIAEWLWFASLPLGSGFAGSFHPALGIVAFVVLLIGPILLVGMSD